MEPDKSKKELLNVLGAGLLAVGMLSIVGVMIGNPNVYLFGEATAVAPFPAPFRDHNGYENFAVRQEFQVHFKEEVGRDPLIFNLGLGIDSFDGTFTGPHRRKIVYMFTINMAPRLPGPLAQQVIRYALCEEPIFADLIGDIDVNDIDGMVLISGVKTIGMEDAVWRHALQCSNTS